MLALSGLLVICLVCVVWMATTSATQIKVNLNYNNHNEVKTANGAVTVKNTHTGVTSEGSRSSVSTKWTSEQLRDLEKTKSSIAMRPKQPQSQRIYHFGKRESDQFVHERRTLDDNIQLERKPPQQQQVRR
jgi:hypothetical protein